MMNMLRETVQTLGEKNLLSRLRKYVKEGGRIVRAISEDCAVLDHGGGNYQLITVDVMVDGEHFRREWMDAFSLGRKAVNVNVSDISAMGGRAQFFLISLGVPRDTPAAYIDEMYRGVDSACHESNLHLAGGNVTAASVLFVDIVMIGEVAKERLLLRSTAKPGDLIFVTGRLGGAACGLSLLDAGRRLDSVTEDWARAAIQSQLDPPVLQNVAGWLAASGMLTSMIDLSDGLASDLPEICRESNVGAEIEALRIPRHECPESAGMNGLELALRGGEDYHLLFTVSRARHKDFLQRTREEGLTVFEIGTILPKEDGICIVDQSGIRNPLGPGFQHF